MKPRIDGRFDLKYPVLNARAQRVWGSSATRDYDGTLHPFEGSTGALFVAHRVFALVYGESVPKVCAPDTFRQLLQHELWRAVLDYWVAHADRR